MTPDEIIAAARTMLGTPFHHQGRLVGVGLDCAGTAIELIKMIGMDPIDRTDYGTDPANNELIKQIDKQGYAERVYDMKPADVLVIRFLLEPQHLAIFTGRSIIHAYQPVGKVCEQEFSEYWRERVVRIYRLKGVKHV